MVSSSRKSYNLCNRSIGEHEYFEEVMDQMKNHIRETIVEMFV